jgi:hypothetical protein
MGILFLLFFLIFGDLAIAITIHYGSINRYQGNALLWGQGEILPTPVEKLWRGDEF